MHIQQNNDSRVLAQLAAEGFDFDKSSIIEFTVEFERWPPQNEAMRLLQQDYPDVQLYPPCDDDAGYVVVRIQQPLSYALVSDTQRQLTRLMAPYGGLCDAWGVVLS
ncbi:ribonuclease E inhibitor RraB [Idiomarina xiamenensis]|uniref:Regulator of ribonuclease activity B domain-containing protein n=1 Tax=Idiomarina xiamenensis 10-D-4 TaxID=740709 RepID=K2KAH3_9GAMM|nr:ribonuclease E inhibitor RraB [Idiomarina xiamenensis]EKE84823.1 hypothetical protein A10D4_04395 [Idiomarina xiamenensis 10-D-4]